MFRLLGLVISIGLADSVNPSTVGPALFLAAGRHPRPAVLEFTAATFAVFLLSGLILTVGPGQAIVSLVPHPNATTRYVLETIAGAAMLVISAVVWRRRHGLAQRQAKEEDLNRRGIARAARSPALMGATIGVIELPTAIPYFAAIAAIVGSGLRLSDQILLVVIYNVCFVLPLLAIVLALTVFGERAVQMLAQARAYLRGHWPVVVAVVAVIAGLFVITLGITGLAGRAHGSVGRLSRRVRHLISR